MDATDPVTGTGLSPADEALIDRARDAVAAAFDLEYLGGAPLVGAAIRDASGATHTGVSVPAGVGRTSTCAEPAAVSEALQDGANALETSVAVRHPLPEEDREFEVVSACGACREQLCDLDPTVCVVFPTSGEPRKAPVAELLPTRHW